MGVIMNLLHKTFCLYVWAVCKHTPHIILLNKSFAAHYSRSSSIRSSKSARGREYEMHLSEYVYISTHIWQTIQCLTYVFKHKYRSI